MTLARLRKTPTLQQSKTMLLPRFSIRVILVTTAIWAVYFLIIGLAMRGASWAAGLAIAATTLILAALIHAMMFAVCYYVGRTFMRSSGVEGEGS